MDTKYEDRPIGLEHGIKHNIYNQKTRYDHKEMQNMYSGYSTKIYIIISVYTELYARSYIQGAQCSEGIRRRGQVGAKVREGRKEMDWDQPMAGAGKEVRGLEEKNKH